MKKAKAMYIPAGGKKAVWGPVDHNVLPEGYPYVGEPAETEIVPTTILEFDGGSLSNPFPITINQGETYFVNWDGTVWECVGQGFKGEGMDGVVLGDGTTIGFPGLSGNGEPFTILALPAAGVVQVADNNNPQSFETHTIAVTEVKPVIHTMDERFLPDNTFTIMFQYYNGSVTSSVTLEEIENALSDGKEIKAKLVYLTSGHIGGGSPMFYIGNAQCIHFDIDESSAYINVFTCTSDGWEKRTISLVTT